MYKIDLYPLVDALPADLYKKKVFTLAETFDQQLRRWRERAGLRQDEVADKLGIKQQTVSDWERGKAKPHARRAAALEEIFGLEPQTVLHALYGTDDDDGVIEIEDEGIGEFEDALRTTAKLSTVFGEEQVAAELPKWRALGKLLGQARKAAGYTKKEAATRAGISPALWGHLEAGVKWVDDYPNLINPRDETLVAASLAVGLDPHVAFDTVERPYPEQRPVSTTIAALSGKWDHLSERDKRAVLRLVDEMLEDNE